MKLLLLISLLCFNLCSVFSQSPLSDSLKTVLKNAANDTTRCSILYGLIESESDDAIWPSYNYEMKAIAEKALQNPGLNPQFKRTLSKYLAASYNNIGYFYSNEGDVTKSAEAYFNCIRIYTQIQDFPAVSFSYICLGNLYKMNGDYLKAMSFFEKAQGISKIANDKMGLSQAIFFEGDIYDFQGNTSASLECYLNSLKIKEEIADRAGIASCFNNIALLYEKQDEYDKALSYHQKSLAINEKFGDQFSIATSLNNIGLCYFKKQNLIEAENFYNKSLKVYKSINDSRGMSFVYVNLGTICTQKKEFDKALEYFNKSLKIRTEIGQKGGVAQCLISISNIYLLQGKLKEAEAHATEGLKLAQEIGYPDKIQNAANILFQIYEKENRSSQALKMHKLFILMRDSVKNINSQKALISQNLKYEYDRKVAADSIKVTEEKKVVNAQLKQEKTQRFALYGGLILVGLFGAFMYNRFKVTQKQNMVIQEQKTELQHQKHLVDEKQKEILDSIHYAKRIQTALIANSEFISENVMSNFILFQPKDIVSGDFYWATRHNDKFYLAVCDSTGHGVPGAFMSLLNMGFLTEAIKEKNIQKPNEVFNYVRDRLAATISNEGQKDGMDGILICIDENNRKVEYVAANNEPILIRNNEVIELPKDKMPVGKGERATSFTPYEIDITKEDTLYLYTDGYADQFGGPKGKKFKYKQLNNLLLQNHKLPLNQQSEILVSTFENWKGSHEQVDDVLIIGIKI